MRGGRLELGTARGHGPWAHTSCLGQHGSLQRPPIQACIIPGHHTKESPGSFSREGVCGVIQGQRTPLGVKPGAGLHSLALLF